MGTAVLRYHDPLKAASSPPPPPMRPSRRKPPRSGPSSPPPSGWSNPPRLPRSSPPLQTKHAGRRVPLSGKENAGAVVVKLPSRRFVMEEVTILKRGQDLSSPLAPQASPDRQSGGAGEDGDDSPFFSTDRLGPEPEILPKRIGLSDAKPVYAGPAFVTSPSPSSLPFPASLVKKGGLDEAATRSLRCLLRLDLP